MFRGGNIRKIW